jgi:hypothetical protein
MLQATRFGLHRVAVDGDRIRSNRKRCLNREGLLADPFNLWKAVSQKSSVDGDDVSVVSLDDTFGQIPSSRLTRLAGQLLELLLYRSSPAQDDGLVR